ncbi:scavenger mRNA decapping enzyme [Annulohypoxylon maeteangense]|uniref:scavenger mRNA decapping enzyme n=1 Tax=Annulohypoxylon maeteangense TaxID=1927788 RepID=UPI0020089CC2|nr:scavenger mRNA decapping enzyme [Annulohypoxylon maeteangense]KAI0890374.1 scavenger mRNA decapping enzyme [Annulohypoxylon maeteangense]
MTPEEYKRRAEALVPKFHFERILNQGAAGREITLYGQVDSQPALLILERAPFPDAEEYLSALPSNLRSITNLGNNDIYSWSLASGGPILEDNENDKFADFKISMICPCTDKHIKKHSRQGFRVVTETPEIYRDKVRPYMQVNREEGRLNWVFNIIEGRKETEDVIYRTPLGRDGDEGFLMLPNLHWDRKTIEALYLLGIVERRDIWSLRDLKKKHIPWLRHMKAKLIDATVKTYPQIDTDQLKLFCHYHPTYYHFHIHVVHVMLEATATQSVGKAIGLDSIIEQLESMQGDSETGMDSVSLSYTLGEASDLWMEIFEPLKSAGRASQSQ